MTSPTSDDGPTSLAETDPSASASRELPELGSEPLEVLVVEDEPVSRLFLTEMLQQRGHTVHATEDAETGLELFREIGPPLALLDRTLPGMSGVELCRRIRDLPGTEDTMILFVTGAEAHEALDEALQAGANDYVVKPATPDILHLRLAIAERRIAERRAHRERERELQEATATDPVTGLWNREMLRDQIGRTLSRARRTGNHRFAVALVDLDGFHGINERHGEEVGDEILKEVARRLERTVRDVDSLSRIAADQFGVLLDELSAGLGPTKAVGRMQEALSPLVEVDGEEIYVSAGFGLAISSDRYHDAEELLRDAAKALNRAKTHGRGEFQIYDPDLHSRALARAELEEGIRNALERRQLKLHYQPIMNLEGGTVHAVEALLRWEAQPGAKLTLPPDFIPVAEETGLIVPVGWWTLETACRQLRAWEDAMPDRPIQMSVNVSARQLALPELEGMVARILERTGVPGHRLHIEVTETSVMQDVTALHEKLEALKELDLHLHIDDFGTGYSSLSQLSRLPFDTVKIDREFIWNMDESPVDLEVVKTIVRLARALRMGIVAEGVETESQEGYLREFGCDWVQGYRYHKPMDADAVSALLAESRPA